MALSQISLAVVGAPYPNRDGSNRQFEVMLCEPREPVELLPEPQNKFDEHAVAVVSARGVQLGYIESERAPYIGGLLRNGRTLQAVFQQATNWGCVIRIGIDEPPSLPPLRPGDPPLPENDEGAGFEPDYIPPDDFL